MSNIQHKRGLRSDLDAMATNSELLVAQIYLITDEGRLAVATSSSSYVVIANQSELPIILTQAEYDLLSPVDENQIYYIVG